MFFNIPQIQYKNPWVQIMLFRNMTPSPFLRFYLGRCRRQRPGRGPERGFLGRTRLPQESGPPRLRRRQRGLTSVSALRRPRRRGLIAGKGLKPALPSAASGPRGLLREETLRCALTVIEKQMS